jgi:hypothetical protein
MAEAINLMTMAAVVISLIAAILLLGLAVRIIWDWRNDD